MLFAFLDSVFCVPLAESLLRVLSPCRSPPSLSLSLCLFTCLDDTIRLVELRACAAWGHRDPPSPKGVNTEREERDTEIDTKEEKRDAWLACWAWSKRKSIVYSIVN